MALIVLRIYSQSRLFILFAHANFANPLNSDMELSKFTFVILELEFRMRSFETNRITRIVDLRTFIVPFRGTCQSLLLGLPSMSSCFSETEVEKAFL